MDKTPFPKKTQSGDPNDSKWLIVSQLNNLKFNTFSQCICLADLFNENENNLLIGDFGDDNNIKLIVLKGAQVQNQIKLADFPVSVLSFSMDSNLKNPLIAIASCKSIFIYKNFKPFFKFTLPSNTINVMESEVWNLYKDGKINSLELFSKLEELQVNLHKVMLTTKTQCLLDLNKNDLELINSFLLSKKDEPLILEDYVICMNKIQKSVSQDSQVCYLVIGTESCDLSIIETEAFTINSSYKLPSQPVFIETYGFYDTDYTIIINCRDASIYTIKRNYKKPKLIIQLSSQCCSILRINDKIYVGCLDCSLICYDLKGYSLWEIQQPASILALTKIKIEIFGIKLIAVALANKEILFYNDKQLCDKIVMDENIVCLKFGKFGREEHTLIMISVTGKLTIAILKRTANFNINGKNLMNEMILNTSKLKLPKKTKYFVHQTVRERDNSIMIHQTFQQDLYRLKLISSRAYVKAINNCLNPISPNNIHPIKLSAQVHGLGPIFKLILELKNISVDQPTENLYLCFNCDLKIYKILPNFVFVPFLSPGYTYNLENKVELITDLGLTESIKIFVCKKNEKIPLITAVINMPKSEQFI